MPASKLLVERRGAVAVLTLNRPDVHNCIDAETADLITGAIESFAADDEARVLVVTGAGSRAFCAGADLTAVDELVRRPEVDRTGPLGFSGLEPGKPRLAAVEGYCIGGGIELACWCDFRVAGEGATFAALNRQVGVPWVDGGTQRLTRIVGQGNALYLMETGERIDARRALDMGLVQEVVPAGQALDRAMALAQRVAAYLRGACWRIERRRWGPGAVRSTRGWPPSARGPGTRRSMPRWPRGAGVSRTGGAEGTATRPTPFIPETPRAAPRQSGVRHSSGAGRDVAVPARITRL